MEHQQIYLLKNKLMVNRYVIVLVTLNGAQSVRNRHFYHNICICVNIIGPPTIIGSPALNKHPHTI